MASFPPQSLLRSRVVAIDVINAQSGHALVLPSTNAVLGFQFRGRVHADGTPLAPAGVTGLQDSAKTYSYADHTASVLVRFTPQGGACLGVSVAELASRSVPLDCILPAARVAEVSERLSAAPDDDARVAVIERFLLNLRFASDPLVTRALELLGPRSDEASVAVAARTLGTSERQLERRFLARVGLTPKRFSLLSRFERAVAHAATAPSLSTAALDAGYYDQSHFIRDVRRFAGMSPRDLLARRRGEGRR